MRRDVRTMVVLVAALSLVLVACPTDEVVDDEPAADGQTVTIAGSEFDPGSLEVMAGTTVSFVNEDPFGHTVTAGAPDEETGEFDESLPSEGDTAEVTVDEPGTFAYFCRIHPNMRAEIVVEP